MPEDPKTYQRGTQTAVVGLLVQLALSVAMALLGVWAQSPALYAATWYFFGGIPVWIILFLIYNQHRLERVEALAAEQLSRRDQAAAAIFDEHADDLDLARRRLGMLNKWGMPITGLIVALYLLGVGLYLLYNNYYFINEGLFTDPDLVRGALGRNISTLLLMFLSAGLGLVAFVAGRYVAGMTKVRQWQMLRGGASYLMGMCLVAILIAIAAGLDAGAEFRRLLGLLAIVIPAIMVLVGLEIALNFLLGAYRPRRAGEVPRPAFDSRFLGILTSPESLGRIISETVNYQFGFEISRSWFYQLLGKAIAPLLATGIVILLVFSSVVIVQPYENAIITDSGKITGVAGPGLHWKLPWPLGGAEKFSIGRVAEVSAGSVGSPASPDVAILWTNQHTTEEEQYLITPPTASKASTLDSSNNPLLSLTFPLAPPSSAPSISARESQASPEIFLIAAEVMVQYRIRDIERYAMSAADVPATLKAISDRQVTQYFASHDMDTLLARGRIDAGEDLRKALQAAADAVPGPKDPSGKATGLGIDIIFVGLIGIHPPQKVATSFHEQIGALQEKEGAIEDAHKEATQTLSSVAGSPEQALAIDKAIQRRQQLKAQLDAMPPAQTEERKKLDDELTGLEANIETLMASASGEAAQKIYEARAYRWQRAITERAKAVRFETEDLAYRKAPEYYRMRQYLDTLADGIATARKIVITGNVSALPSIMRIDLKDSPNAMEAITKPAN